MSEFAYFIERREKLNGNGFFLGGAFPFFDVTFSIGSNKETVLNKLMDDSLVMFITCESSRNKFMIRDFPASFSRKVS